MVVVARGGVDGNPRIRFPSASLDEDLAIGESPGFLREEEVAAPRVFPANPLAGHLKTRFSKTGDHGLGTRKTRLHGVAMIWRLQGKCRAASANAQSKRSSCETGLSFGKWCEIGNGYLLAKTGLFSFDSGLSVESDDSAWFTAMPYGEAVPDRSRIRDHHSAGQGGEFA
jgi:hypothetical protein